MMKKSKKTITTDVDLLHRFYQRKKAVYENSFLSFVRIYTKLENTKKK
jgi:hypothetical protein